MDKRIAYLAAPACLFVYGICWLLDGARGYHGPGLYWTIGHAFFLLAFAWFAVAIWDLRAYAGKGWLANLLAAIALLGVAVFLRVGVIDLVTGWEAPNHAAMAAISRRLNAWPSSRIAPFFGLGPLLFQLGLLALLVRLTLAGKLGWHSPILVLLGFLTFVYSLNLLAPGAVLIGLGFLPLLKSDHPASA